MYDLEKLHKQCRLYMLKKRLPWLVAFVLLGLVGVYFLLTKEEKNVSVQVHTKVTKETSKKVAEKTQNKSISKPQTLAKPLTQKLIPSKEEQSSPVKPTQKDVDFKCYKLQIFASKAQYTKYLNIAEKKARKAGLTCNTEKEKGFLYLRCNATQSYDEILRSAELAKRHKFDYLIIKKKDPCAVQQKVADKPEGKMKEAKKQAVVVQKPKPAPKTALQVETIDIERLIREYRQTPSYMAAVAIANYFYANGQYEQSLAWAKKANKLNKTDEQSWILYAKSFYALGEKNKAKKILHTYLQFRNSQKIKQILKKWR